MRALAPVLVVAACGTGVPALPEPAVPPDAPTPPLVTITATRGSTRFVVREHMLAAAEMQISGEPLAETMGRNLGGYSRIHVPTDLYFDSSLWSAGPWIDLPGYSTAVESYEYSKQPMNALAFELGAGTSLAYAPLVNRDGAHGAAADAHAIDLVQRLATASNALGRFVSAPGTTDPYGWPGMWPTVHVFASFDPAIAPTGTLLTACSISSDDNPGETGGVTCADYECDATSLHLVDRAGQIDRAITPGADGFATWKYALWTLNYLQVMHDANEAAVASVDDAEITSVGGAGNQVVGVDDSGAPTAPGTYIGSSRIEGFQAGMFIAMVDNRAADWLGALTTTDGATLSGFASVGDALAYDYSVPLRWFPGRVAVTESDDGARFPMPAYALASADSSLLDLAGVVLGYATIYALTDPRNAAVGGAATARVYFDGDPFTTAGEDSLHDRALAMLRVAIIDIDRMHRDATSGVLVDDAAIATRGATVTTVSAAYTLIALRTAQRALSSQLELYSNNTPDTHGIASPLDALPIRLPEDPAQSFGGRLDQLVRAQAALLYEHLTDATGRAYVGWDVSGTAIPGEVLDAHAAAVRGLFAAYLATGDVRYRNRALAVFARMNAVFYDADARIYVAAPAPQTDVEYTPQRFALVQSTLRDVYELVATRPGNEALELELEQRLGRLDKLVLDGWDDRNYDRLVEWPSECVNVVDAVPRGGLQMGERTLTGELGRVEERVLPGHKGTPTADREHDCVPEIDDAQLPAALADSVTFHIARAP